MRSIRKTGHIVFVSVLTLALSAFIAGPCFADGPAMKIRTEGEEEDHDRSH